MWGRWRWRRWRRERERERERKREGERYRDRRFGLQQYKRSNLWMCTVNLLAAVSSLGVSWGENFMILFVLFISFSWKVKIPCLFCFAPIRLPKYELKSRIDCYKFAWACLWMILAAINVKDRNYLYVYESGNIPTFGLLNWTNGLEYWKTGYVCGKEMISGWSHTKKNMFPKKKVTFNLLNSENRQISGLELCYAEFLWLSDWAQWKENGFWRELYASAWLAGIFVPLKPKWKVG